MKHSAWAVLVALLMAGSACAPAANAPQSRGNVEQDTAAVNKSRADYVSAWKAGDAARLASLYAEDAIILPGNQPTATGRSAIAKYNQDFFEQFAPGNIELGSQEMKLMGDWAFDRGTYKVMATPKTGGDPVREQGRYLVILQREADGSWKIARDTDNLDSAPAPPLPALGSNRK